MVQVNLSIMTVAKIVFYQKKNLYWRPLKTNTNQVKKKDMINFYIFKIYTFKTKYILLNNKYQTFFIEANM